MRVYNHLAQKSASEKSALIHTDSSVQHSGHLVPFYINLIPLTVNLHFKKSFQLSFLSYASEVQVKLICNNNNNIFLLLALAFSSYLKTF